MPVPTLGKSMYLAVAIGKGFPFEPIECSTLGRLVGWIILKGFSTQLWAGSLPLSHVLGS
jgi:hypothetical protein